MNRVLLAAVLAAAFMVGLPAGGQNLIEFDATSGAVSPPFTTSNGYLLQASLGIRSNENRAVYTFAVTNRGDYILQALVHAPGPDGNSICVNIDAEPLDPEMRWEVPLQDSPTTNSIWMIVRANGRERLFTLEPGTHQLILTRSEPKLKLVRFRLVPHHTRPATPSALRLVFQ